MQCREPSKQRNWRLLNELIEERVIEDSSVETVVEEEDTDSETDSDLNTEDEWEMEQSIFGDNQ